MWRVLVLVSVLSYTLPHAEGFSFFSQVFFRMLFPKPHSPPPVIVQPPPEPPNGRSKSMKEEVTDQMTSGNSPEKMVENLVYTLISTSREIVPDEFELTDDTYDLPVTGKLHMNKGKVRGVRSYDQPILQSQVDHEGHMEFTVVLHFNNLVATFDDIYLDLLGTLFDKRGTGTFLFKKNKFSVKLRVVKTSKIFEMMTKNDCVLFVKSVDITELSDVIVDIYNQQKNRAFYTSAIVDVMIVSLEEMLREQLTLGISKWMWDLLPDKNAFTCRDSNLKDLIKLIESQQKTQSTTAASPTAPGTEHKNNPQVTSDAKPEEQTGVLGSLKNWWNGGTPAKQDGLEQTPNSPPAKQTDQQEATQQQGWVQSAWNWWNKKPSPKEDDGKDNKNLKSDGKSIEIEGSLKEGTSPLKTDENKNIVSGNTKQDVSPAPAPKLNTQNV